MDNLARASTRDLLGQVSLLRERAEWRRQALLTRDDRVDLIKVGVELSLAESQIARIEKILISRARSIPKEMGFPRF